MVYRFVMLSAAKHLSRWAEMLRCAQHDKQGGDNGITARELLLWRQQGCVLGPMMQFQN